MDKPAINRDPVTKIKQYAERFPSQFWLLFWGTLVNTTGMSMIWPFLAVYLSGELSLPLTAVGSLISIDAVMSLISSLAAGSITDRIGRKWAMVISLAVTGFAFLLMIPASTYLQYTLLMMLRGSFRPLFRVGSDAMLADLVRPEERNDAYALNRLGKNAGVAIGPALGGLVASNSYSITFTIAAGATIFFSILIASFAFETLPVKVSNNSAVERKKFGGYGEIFADSVFAIFILGFTFRQLSGSMLWTLLAAYAKDNYGLTESLYGLIPTTNALMVVFLQLLVTRRTVKFNPLVVMAAGTALYGLGVGSVAFSNGFWGFWISMVILTIGELMVIPTASTFTANRAPEDMRGRYMSMLALTWGAGSMIGPLLGGILNDQFQPQAIWVGGGIAGFIGALVYSYLILQQQKNLPAPA